MAGKIAMGLAHPISKVAWDWTDELSGEEISHKRVEALKTAFPLPSFNTPRPSRKSVFLPRGAFTQRKRKKSKNYNNGKGTADTSKPFGSTQEGISICVLAYALGMTVAQVLAAVAFGNKKGRWDCGFELRNKRGETIVVLYEFDGWWYHREWRLPGDISKTYDALEANPSNSIIMRVRAWYTMGEFDDRAHIITGGAETSTEEVGQFGDALQIKVVKEVVQKLVDQGIVVGQDCQTRLEAPDLLEKGKELFEGVKEECDSQYKKNKKAMASPKPVRSSRLRRMGAAASTCHGAARCRAVGN